MDSDSQNHTPGRFEWTRAGWLLGGFAMLAIFLLALTYEATREQIGVQEKRLLEDQLHQLLVPGSYDNDPTADVLEIPGKDKNDHLTVYRARLRGEPVAALIRTIAPDGYSGSIQLLVGIRHDGTLLGVRALSHRETPGLGDEIDLRRSDWILGFNNRSLYNPQPDGWAVKKDGGEFDTFTGATITPRAVVREIRDTLLYYRDHQASLFQ